jgi:hypothetical protein
VKPRPWPKLPRRCGHCYSAAKHVACTTCNRDMCEDCISYGDAGLVCGLCYDREAGRYRYDALVYAGRNLPPFDEWYDRNA